MEAAIKQYHRISNMATRNERPMAYGETLYNQRRFNGETINKSCAIDAATD